MGLLRKYFCLGMALLMLGVSIGITAHKMVCSVSGAVSFSFFEADDCCAKGSESTNSLTPKCCNYSTDYFKLDIQTLTSNFDLRFDLFPVFSFQNIGSFQNITTNQLSEFSTTPPLLTGKSILLFVSVFRI